MAYLLFESATYNQAGQQMKHVIGIQTERCISVLFTSNNKND